MGCTASKIISVGQAQVVMAANNNTNNKKNGKEDTPTNENNNRDCDEEDGVHIGRLICTDPFDGGPMLIPISDFIFGADFPPLHEVTQQQRLEEDDEDEDKEQEVSTRDSETKDTTVKEDTKDDDNEDDDDDEDQEQEHQQQQQQQQQRTTTLSSSEEYEVELDTTTTITCTTSTSRSHSTSSTVPNYDDNNQRRELWNTNKKKNRTTITLLNGSKLGNNKSKTKKGKSRVMSSPTKRIHRVCHTTSSTTTIIEVEDDISIAF